MKYLLAAFVLIAVAEGRSFLPTDFLVNIDKFDVETMDPEFFSTNTYGRVDMFNDSTSYGVFEVFQLRDFSGSETMMFHAIGYKFSNGNRWFQVADIRNQPLCPALQNNPVAKMIFRSSNIELSQCPTTKGLWYAKELVYDNNLILPGTTPCKLKVVVTITNGKKDILKVTVLAEIVEKEDKK